MCYGCCIGAGKQTCHEHAGLAQQSTSHTQQLPLPDAEVVSVFRHVAIKAAWQPRHHILMLSDMAHAGH